MRDWSVGRSGIARHNVLSESRVDGINVVEMA